VLEHRPQLLVDALTVLRAYHLARERGMTPSMPHPLPSFEMWSRIVREPLLWLGWTDPVGSLELEEDEDLAQLQEAFRQLAGRDEFKPGTRFRPKDIVRECGVIAGEALREAIEASGCQDATSTKFIGYWLRDKVAGPYKLVRGTMLDGMPTWSLKPR
jgi:hypothetical protein